MQELEKTLLKETEQLVNMHYEDDSVKTIILRNLRDIRKHMNDSWIPVEERLPERDETVLACQCGGAIDAAWHDGYRWKTGFSHADWLRDVVAWRSLPEPYRPERSDNHDGE